jgi:hypothetical protein
MRVSHRATLQTWRSRKRRTNSAAILHEQRPADDRSRWRIGQHLAEIDPLRFGSKLPYYLQEPGFSHSVTGTSSSRPCSTELPNEQRSDENARRGTQAPHRRLSPRVDARSKPVSVPLPHPRFAVQARTRACHDGRSAFGSRRFRVASGPHRARAMGTLRSRAGRGARGRAVPTPVSFDRTRGNDAGMELAAILRGITEGTKRCPDSSTACN